MLHGHVGSASDLESRAQTLESKGEQVSPHRSSLSGLAPCMSWTVRPSAGHQLTQPQRPTHGDLSSWCSVHTAVPSPKASWDKIAPAVGGGRRCKLTNVYTLCIHMVPMYPVTRVHTLSPFPVYREAQSLALCAWPGELLLPQPVCVHGGHCLNPPPTHLDRSWILCPPVSDFLPVFLTVFALTSVSCVPLLCLGLGRDGEVGLGRGYVPIDLPSFL